MTALEVRRVVVVRRVMVKREIKEVRKVMVRKGVKTIREVNVLILPKRFALIIRPSGMDWE